MNPAAALTTTALALRRDFKAPEFLATNTSLDQAIQGFPRGGISEIAGPDSSGRTAIAYTALAAATQRQEICAYVDTNDSLDPASAAATGVLLERLIWIRCNGHAGHAMKAADNLLHAGGFGVIVLDLCHVSQRDTRRIPNSYWYRFRLAIENTPSVLLLLEREPLAKSCAALSLDMKRSRAHWDGAPGFHLLRGIDVQATPRKRNSMGVPSCNFRIAV